MAFVLVQHTSADFTTGATTGNLSFGGATTAGNLIVVMLRVGGTSTAAITDDAATGGNNGAGPSIQGSDIGLAQAGLGTAYIFSAAMSSKAATQITYTLTGGATTVRMAIAEYSGVLNTGAPLDKTSSNYTVTNTASPHNSGNTATTTQASELLIGVDANNIATSTYTAGTSLSSPVQQWTLREVVPAVNARLAFQDGIVSVTGTFQSDISNSGWPNVGAGDSIGLIATYKAPADAGGIQILYPLGDEPAAMMWQWDNRY